MDLSCWTCLARLVQHFILHPVFDTLKALNNIWERKWVRLETGRSPTSQRVPIHNELMSLISEGRRQRISASKRKEPSLSFQLHEKNGDSFLNNLNLFMVKIISTQDSPSKIRSVQFKLELVTPQGNMINTFNSNQLDNKMEGWEHFSVQNWGAGERRLTTVENSFRLNYPDSLFLVPLLISF